MLRFLILVLVVLTATNVIGCSQTGSEAPIMLPADKAKLLTAQDVEKVYGKPITFAPKDVNLDGDLNFRSTTERNTVVLKLHVHPDSRAFNYAKKEALLSAQSGLGDEAFWIGPELPSILYVRKGSRDISLVTTGGSSKSPPPMVNQNQLVELAKIVLSRL